MKRILPILLALVLLTSLMLSCEKKPGAEGLYTLKSIDGAPLEEQFAPLLDEGMSMEDLLSLFGLSSLEEYFTIDLKADGTIAVTIAGEDTTTGTWKQEGDKITAVMDEGDPIVMTWNGSELSFVEDGQNYVFIKK